jgi:hypothetical protein
MYFICWFVSKDMVSDEAVWLCKGVGYKDGWRRQLPISLEATWAKSELLRNGSTREGLHIFTDSSEIWAVVTW